MKPKELISGYWIVKVSILAVIAIIYFLHSNDLNEREIGNNNFPTEAITGVTESEVPPGITVTQYHDTSGSQAMFYTIETGDGLYVVDGGIAANAPYVRQILKEKGNVVSGWILTHPHPDHIGAFTEIYPELGEIRLGTIYAVEMDYEIFQAYGQPWDDFATYEKWYELTKEAANLTYLHEGDILDLSGMRLEVYHAFSLENPFLEPGQDPINWGSMVFEIFGKSESMLFSSDINGKVVCDFIMSRHGDKLQADYFQIGHHGNQSVTHEFIQLVNPQKVFFDTPQWIFDGANYDAAANREFCLSLGMEVLSYETAPNEVVIE